MIAISHELSTFYLLMLVKATVLLAATVLCLRLARNASASSRHMICTLSLTGLVLLPVLMIALPSRNVEGTLPGITYAVFSMVHVRPAGTRPSTLIWDRMLLFGWLSGAALVLLRLFLGWGLMGRERRKSAILQDEAWCSDLTAIAQQNGLAASRISLRAGPVSSALTCGVLRPVILVPRAALTWNVFQRRAILLHEVAHIRRHDCFFNYVTQLACALFWFHPLAWKVAANQHREQELACDDAVLSHGVAATEYANVLLEGARSLPSGFLFACAFGGTSRPHHFRQRLAYVLDGNRNHAAHASLAKWFATSFLLLLVAVSAIKTCPGARDLQRWWRGFSAEAHQQV